MARGPRKYTGYVWAAANTNGKLVRFSPNGQVVAEVEVPGAKMCSSLAFGGSIADEESSGDVY